MLRCYCALAYATTRRAGMGARWILSRLSNLRIGREGDTCHNLRRSILHIHTTRIPSLHLSIFHSVLHSRDNLKLLSAKFSDSQLIPWHGEKTPRSEVDSRDTEREAPEKARDQFKTTDRSSWSLFNHVQCTFQLLHSLFCPRLQPPCLSSLLPSRSSSA